MKKLSALIIILCSIIFAGCFRTYSVVYIEEPPIPVRHEVVYLHNHHGCNSCYHGHHHYHHDRVQYYWCSHSGRWVYIY